jgi:hypothetical protein
VITFHVALESITVCLALTIAAKPESPPWVEQKKSFLPFVLGSIATCFAGDCIVVLLSTGNDATKVVGRGNVELGAPISMTNILLKLALVMKSSFSK